MKNEKRSGRQRLLEFSKLLVMEHSTTDHIMFGCSELLLTPDLLEFDILDVEAAINELAMMSETSTDTGSSISMTSLGSEDSEESDKKSNNRPFKKGDRIWVINQDFSLPLMATVTESYLDSELVYFIYDGQPDETHSSFDHRILLILSIEHQIKEPSFSNALKSLWQGLIVRQVKFVKKNGRGYAKYYDGREKETVEYETFKEAFDRVSITERTKVVFHEYHYYGFTNNHTLYDNDRYADIEFFFGSENAGQLTHDVQWSASDIPMSLSERVHRAPPLSGKLICGMPEITSEGWQLKRWIPCSRQFLNLWKFVMGMKIESPEALIKSVIKLPNIHPKFKMLQDIFEILDTELTARLCLSKDLVAKVRSELKYAKMSVDTQGCEHWVTNDCDKCGVHISKAAKIYFLTMVTVYGLPSNYTLSLDR
uniref:Uncharacterized protein n=1 Tax=Pithovirus LCPAC103 TaxID=2506588 RepID=A0A481Z3D7_9VIRU|nr:MAG: hypothetical protein LCPAC103_00280 [Pithovirus LCPAC103]